MTKKKDVKSTKNKDYFQFLRMEQIFLVRHGNRLDFVHPEWFTIARRKYDPPLSTDGKKQIEVLAQSMMTETIDHIFASPFLRTIQTADILAKRFNLPIKLEAGLGEWHNPDWMSEPPQIHPRHELEPEYQWIDWHYFSQVVPQYPETQEQVSQRVKLTIDKLISQWQGTTLIVGHSITVTGIIQALINDLEPMATPSLGSLNRLIKSEQGQWKLQSNEQNKSEGTG